MIELTQLLVEFVISNLVVIIHCQLIEILVFICKLLGVDPLLGCHLISMDLFKHLLEVSFDLLDVEILFVNFNTCDHWLDCVNNLK